ncbi:alkane 1-monooxygenase [Acuticoccus sediminis]|uniref:Luciferase-like monooxygenase n=1 Tax=Acuticoccus sediminis TaxID=2184697 RepID=A0A8B2P0A4_9HYPH|nr:LLM class flavin-dependent oxidoreductase [Acuticoccus sediminis]RAI04410.1 alkane 1-monooxygenase [Acuticoccus sediminis]
MVTYNILDLSPIPEGGTAADALARSTDLAQHAEQWGYTRFWVAEHHNMPGIASSATAVLIGHLAANTKTIRLGSGGIMLPNHAPLMVAEQFGTLETLYPGRIDLGLGRAPGTDPVTTRALRRYGDQADQFPQDVAELIAYLDSRPGETRVSAIPGAGTHVPVWILGSSTFGAELAAVMGLPYAFASHFAPNMLEDALAVYRRNFRPSDRLEQSRFALAVNVYAADTDEEAQYLRSSQLQAVANLRSGRPGPLPRPVRDLTAVVSPNVMPLVEGMQRFSAVGSPATVRRTLANMIAHYEPDEIFVVAAIHDHEARLKSMRMAAEVLADLPAAAAAE